MSDKNTPAGVTLRYAVFAALWIILSGYLLTITVADSHTQSLIEMGKGLAFVAITSALLYLLLHRWHAALQRQSKLYEALSQCNKAIVRSKSPAELFSAVCRDAVQFGGMKMAWIGMLDDGGKRVTPVASYGAGIDYLQEIRISVDAGEPAGRGPTGTAIREDRPVWCQDFQRDQTTTVWHEHGAQFGWKASASIPLRRKGGVVGALTLYADQVSAFDTAEQNLLLEMGADISFALDRFADELLQQQADEQIHSQSENMSTLLEVSQQLISSLDLKSLLQTTAESIIQLTRMQYSAVYLLNDDRMRLWAVAPPLPASYPEALRNPPLADYPHIMQTINSREFVLLPDMQIAELSAAERYMAEMFSLRTALFLPLLVGDKVLGILTVTSAKQTVEIGASKLGVCRTLANFCAIAANNAQLFQAIELHTAQLEHRIAERDLAEDKLRKLSLAVEQSPNTIVITDLDARIEYANANFSQVSGFTMDEAIGQNPRMLQSGKTPKATYDDMWAHLTRGETWRGELINRNKDGSEYIESAIISPVRQADGKITNYLAIKENITDKRLAEERIQNLAHFDQLTGLPNRSLLTERFKYAHSLAQRSGEKMAVMFLDLDHFKDINDTLGHSIGDQLLMEIALRLKAHIRDEDTVSRLGGDEFILVLPGNDENGAALVATKLLEMVSQPCLIEGHELIITSSIGIAIYPDDGEDFEALLKNADTAMYRVKQDSHNGFRFFKQEMQTHSARSLQLGNALRHALTRDELRLHYQPQITLQDGHIVGAEALLRWQHPELGMISPAEFIPIAEASGQIIQIGEWVLRTAAAQLKQWMDKGLPRMMMAVNLSAAQFRHPNLPEMVTRILDEAKLPHELLELELTEAVTMDDPQAAVAVMDKLDECGIRMSIDDFGTGYSSLSYLKRFKVYKLKIDQSFVRDITHDADDKAIVTAIINMASSLGMHTIAEGVETAGQLAFLRLQGCDEVQGYYFSKPLPADEFEAFLRK
ncbi:MAG: EAL domain-containing protein [Sideroxydans sp.]|nr:EAL domain-containing protein [Sideroxydans sp.]